MSTYASVVLFVVKTQGERLHSRSRTALIRYQRKRGNVTMMMRGVIRFWTTRPGIIRETTCGRLEEPIKLTAKLLLSVQSRPIFAASTAFGNNTRGAQRTRDARQEIDAAISRKCAISLEITHVSRDPVCVRDAAFK